MDENGNLDYIHEEDYSEAVSYTHLDVYKRQPYVWLYTYGAGGLKVRLCYHVVRDIH